MVAWGARQPTEIAFADRHLPRLWIARDPGGPGWLGGHVWPQAPGQVQGPPRYRSILLLPAYCRDLRLPSPHSN